jgi:signal transduction histidine kinase
MNLLVNAAQSIPKSGTITVRTGATKAGVQVAINDTGEGIAPENMSRIFDPGFTTKGVGVGTGLGLSICYKIVTAHRGRIEVESSLGKGSTFIVTIPSNTVKDVKENSNHDRAFSSDNSFGG